LARASFGVSGANIPAMLRAIVACGWFGIQTWIGGFALYQMFRLWIPSLEQLPQVFPPWFGLQTGPAITFLLFWLLNMYVVYLGVESIRKLLVFKAIFLPVAALALLFWAISAANGLGPILNTPSKFTDSASFFRYFFPALTGMVGFWATLSLNIPDFTRYAKSQQAQVRGQAIGLPTSMTLFAFIGVVVTSATTIIYGTTIWDPVVLAGRFESKWLVSLAMIAVAVSTLATNIAANIVSPANDFSNLAPQQINFRKGDIEDLCEGLNNWMDEKGFQTLNDFIGKSVPALTHWEDLDINYHHVAHINQDKCIRCGLCYIGCEDTSHQAISLAKGNPYNTYVIKENECVGCNLCQLICPVDDCITMVEQRKGDSYINWKDFQRLGMELNDH
ncbi:MAG: cytosine permease, partial [Chitinophagaceae bacterium]